MHSQQYDLVRKVPFSHPFTVGVMYENFLPRELLHVGGARA